MRPVQKWRHAVGEAFKYVLFFKNQPKLFVYELHMEADALA